MNLDLREMLVCLATIAVIAAATIVAVGAAATYSYVLHASWPQHAASGGLTLASTIDPCVDTFAVRAPTSAPESGLQCPVYRESGG
ncbi:MAG TPA: hypothetical protein VK281_08175 [Xanthobacteraceae bacterium]|nr:hypothetical protein [Xanthobacteraceae bacterium]